MEKSRGKKLKEGLCKQNRGIVIEKKKKKRKDVFSFLPLIVLSCILLTRCCLINLLHAHESDDLTAQRLNNIFGIVVK